MKRDARARLDRPGILTVGAKSATGMGKPRRVRANGNEIVVGSGLEHLNVKAKAPKRKSGARRTKN